MSIDASLLELFQTEVETQAHVLASALLALERDRTAAPQLEICMRAAHSLKGAARIVGLDVGVRVTHAMEDCFVAAQQGRIVLGPRATDDLLGATDLLSRIAGTPDSGLGQWAGEKRGEVERCLSALAATLEGREDTQSSDDRRSGTAPQGADQALPGPDIQPGSAWIGRDNSDRVLRVSAENVNRLLGLAGESLVESRWVKPFSDSLLRLKRMQRESSISLDRLRSQLSGLALDEPVLIAFAEAQQTVTECQRFLSHRLAEIEMFDQRALNLSHRLYDEALACRMRPFADGVPGFPRMVRDLAHSLGKQVRLDIVGEATQVDRDILVKLDAPLGHLLRNAMDHGLEAREERLAAGKPAEGVVRLEARHSAGALQIIVADDGRGIDLEQIREKVVARSLIHRDAAGRLSEAELLEFLFLPGFTMKNTVTEISGRGVGLDAVQDMVAEVHGTVRVFSESGKGTRFVLQLPVTLSVVRTLLADVGGEPYAFPLASITRTVKLSKKKIEFLEGRQHVDVDGRRIGLVSAHQVLGTHEPATVTDELSVIMLGNHSHTYGLVVDRFLGERELVVQPLDVQLGKIKDISAGAFMTDGSPVLIVDAEDLIRSMDRLISTGGLSRVTDGAAATGGKRRKRVLVVDDSLTVRELERKLLVNQGFEVEIAVDGMDGWNAVRTGKFNLVITDIDMPRMDGIELVTLINKDAKLKSVPVMVVSYKDRAEDRQRGLEAGAAYYLTKGSFHDETLIQAVVDLIGEAGA